MTWLKGLILALLVGVSLAACGGDNDKKDASGIVIKDAWVRPTTTQMDSSSSGSMESSGDVSGAFMVIENTSNQADQLVRASVSADVAETVEIHETTIDEDSVMRMRPVDEIEVPANGKIELQPGAYHIMLLNVKKELKPGDKVPLTLTFASGKTVTVEAEVRAMEG
jgi:copper(I)-binding protein